MRSIAFAKTEYEGQFDGWCSLHAACMPAGSNAQTHCRPKRRTELPLLATRWYYCMFVFISISTKTMLVLRALSVCMTTANWTYFATLSKMNVGSRAPKEEW